MNNKKILLAVIAFVALLAIILTVYFVTKPKGTEGEKTVTVVVKYSDAESKEWTITTKREYLADALIDEGLFTEEDISSGMTHWVDGKYADQTLEQWWAVYADGEMPNYGMKEIPLKDGSCYELVFTVGYDMFG